MSGIWSITRRRLEEVNAFLEGEPNPVLDPLRLLVERHGGAEAINRQARENGSLPALLARVGASHPEHAERLRWLQEQRDEGRFVPIEEYRRSRCRGAGPQREGHEVTLEISALQYFPWLVRQARRALERDELMPGRFIRVRCMKEQEQDGELAATVAAMKILEASWVESLDTRGSDGSNVHLGGAETIAGYFGGIGQPNGYPYRWAEELLYYYTRYGVKQVLNINSGTVLAGYLLYRLGVDIEFKISVFLGNDNPLSVLWTLLAARLFCREDGSTALVGFNLSNSVDNATIESTAAVRRALGLEDNVRIEHHILEAYRSIVRQPYDRLAELTEVAARVRNISAKHEGAEPEVERLRPHPSDILDYFLPKEEVLARGLMEAMEQNYLDKHEAVQRTAVELMNHGLPVLAAPALHHRA